MKTIKSPTSASTSDAARVTTIVTTTVGAGVLLVIFLVLLMKYKRRNESKVINIPMEIVDAPQESLPIDEVNYYDHDAFDPISNHFRIMHEVRQLFVSQSSFQCLSQRRGLAPPPSDDF